MNFEKGYKNPLICILSLKQLLFSFILAKSIWNIETQFKSISINKHNIAY